VLVVFTDRVHRFDNDEKRLCAALASLGAVALQNARLYARVFQSEESLRKNERLTTLGLLAAEIAHEIRNPLTVLKLLQGGLGADFPPDDPRRTDLRVIGEKLDQLEAIVTRVLNFAKAPSSLHTRCSLVEIVEDTLVLVRLKLAQNKIHTAFDPPAGPLVVDGHKGQLQQVLLNLLINAMQAMPERRGDHPDTLAPGPRRGPVAVLDIADTGTGVPERDPRPPSSTRSFRAAPDGHRPRPGDRQAGPPRPSRRHRPGRPARPGTTFRVTLPLAKN
jgi:signal transduction histidine kinase